MTFYNILKSIAKKLLKKDITIPEATEKFIAFKKNGNLEVGIDSNISELSIHAYKTSPGLLNIEIGDDCYLMGNIVLHSENSRIKIGNRVFVGPGSTLFCYDSIEVDDDVMISWGCTIIDTNAHSLNSEERANDVLDWKKGPEFKDWKVVVSKPIKIEKKCWIGFNSIITKGVLLKEGTVVASGSVVTKATEAYTIVGGNPAKFIKTTK